MTLTISDDHKLTEKEAREEADDNGELTVIIEGIYLDDLIRGGHWSVVRDAVEDEDEREWLHDFTFKRIEGTDGYSDGVTLDLVYTFTIKMEEEGD